MNDHITHSLRRHINIFAIYRTLLCCLAAASIAIASAFWLSEILSPQSMESRIVKGQSLICLPDTLREDEEMEPMTEGSLKKEIYITQPDTDNKEAPAENIGIFPITEIDMSNGAEPGEVMVRDSDSGLNVDVQKLLHSPYPPALKEDDFSKVNTTSPPLVLILHTHATESYADNGVTTYTSDTSFRSEDSEKNVVAVGKVMADTLNSKGINTLHCTILHDKDDYNGAYDNSLATVKRYLNEYPSIKYVFDIHRDAMIRETGEALKPVCNIEGRQTAQIMTLVGTDAGGAAHPDWQNNNMNLAVKLQSRLTAEYNGMARPINTRRLSFHQQYAPGSLLFEIGSCANTLEEAKAAAACLAEAIADTIRN